jgi:hypothetical protein
VEAAGGMPVLAVAATPVHFSQGLHSKVLKKNLKD